MDYGGLESNRGRLVCWDDQSRDGGKVLREQFQHPRRVARGGRMVERIEEHPARAENHLLLAAMHAGDAERLAGQELRGEVPERRHEPRLDQLDLVEEMRLAGRDLLRQRVAIL